LIDLLLHLSWLGIWKTGWRGELLEGELLKEGQMMSWKMGWGRLEVGWSCCSNKNWRKKRRLEEPLEDPPCSLLDLQNQKMRVGGFE